MARKKKIHHRHNRLSFGGKLAFVLLTILSAVILIPIVFTFLVFVFSPVGNHGVPERARQLRHNEVAGRAVFTRDVFAPAVLQDFH